MSIKVLSTILMLSLSTIATSAELSVSINNIQHDRGQVRVILYSHSDSFLDEDKSLFIEQVSANKGMLTVNFNQLDPGDYAVVAYHDEDADNELDRFLGMIPSEGYGLSNNPKVFGKPEFNDARISVNGNESIMIKLNY
jgi:uncharacterized protein (DUF2141 family)